jgi:hypothetical protein
MSQKTRKTLGRPTYGALVDTGVETGAVAGVNDESTRGVFSGPLISTS